uniref:ATP synthase complex subunit 8 n=1 Tax=Ascaphus truei TaxID=8439 RepID=Q2HQU4_ASCTR|nr:ATPase subunit 8 [Ascaphus truei]
MPQLNPKPWFAILIFSWLILLTLIPTKIINHMTSNETSIEKTKKMKPQSWFWPWT